MVTRVGLDNCQWLACNLRLGLHPFSGQTHDSPCKDRDRLVRIIAFLAIDVGPWATLAAIERRKVYRGSLPVNIFPLPSLKIDSLPAVFNGPHARLENSQGATKLLKSAQTCDYASISSVS